MKKLLAVILCVPFIALAHNAERGTSRLEFGSRTFLRIKPNMTYKQVTTIVGSDGSTFRRLPVNANEDVRWHWDGAHNSSLNIDMHMGKVTYVLVTDRYENMLTLDNKGTRTVFKP